MSFSYDEAPRPLTDSERRQLHRMFSDFMEVPGEWKAAMKADLERDPPLLFGSGQTGPTGATGPTGPAGPAGQAEVGYDQITSPVTVSSTTEATGTTVIAGTVHAFDGNAVIAEFFSELATVAASAGALLVVSLFEGATQLGRLAALQGNASGAALLGRRKFTPAAGNHTYSVTAYQSGGNGTISAGAGGTGAVFPAYLRFTKV